MFLTLWHGGTFLLYDEASQQVLVAKGDWISQDYTILGPFHTTLGDSQGNSMEVSPDGALKVADWGSKPVHGTDAAGADTYATIVVAPRQCRYLHAAVATNPAMISIDGGSTDSLVVQAAGSTLFSGLDIQPGAAIQAKNANAAANYATLHISVW